MRGYIHMHIYVYVYVHAYICICICAYIHMYQSVWVRAHFSSTHTLRLPSVYDGIACRTCHNQHKKATAEASGVHRRDGQSPVATSVHDLEHEALAGLLLRIVSE